MPKSMFIDFKAVKSSITMEQILQKYGSLDQFKRNGDSLTDRHSFSFGKP